MNEVEVANLATNQNWGYTIQVSKDDNDLHTMLEQQQ